VVCAGDLLAHHRPHHRNRQHRDELHGIAFGGHEVPRGALGEDLALAVGVDTRSVDDRPVVLGEDVVGVRMAEADGVEGRSEHDPLDTGVPCGVQNTQRTVTRRDDHIVLVLDILSVNGRGHVQYELAAAARVRPPVVAGEVGLREGQCIAVRHASVGENGAHRALTLRGPHGRADDVSLLKELEDAVAGDEAGPAGDEYAPRVIGGTAPDRYR
jgi:hypothetical protein